MKRARKITVIILIVIGRIVLSAIQVIAGIAIISILFFASQPDLSTDTWSFSITDQEKKLSFLAEYLEEPSEVLDAEYYIDYMDTGGLGPSEWDIRAALLINTEDIPLWTEGFTEIPAEEIDFAWWDGLQTEDINWGSGGFICYKRPESLSYLVVYPDTGIILKAFSTTSLYPLADKTMELTEPAVTP